MAQCQFHTDINKHLLQCKGGDNHLFRSMGGIKEQMFPAGDILHLEISKEDRSCHLGITKIKGIKGAVVGGGNFVVES